MEEAVWIIEMIGRLRSFNHRDTEAQRLKEINIKNSANSASSPGTARQGKCAVKNNGKEK